MKTYLLKRSPEFLEHGFQKMIDCNTLQERGPIFEQHRPSLSCFAAA